MASQVNRVSVEDMASATDISRKAGSTSVEGMADKADLASGEDMGETHGSQDEPSLCGRHGQLCTASAADIYVGRHAVLV